MNMKRSTLLALCLIGSWGAFAQTGSSSSSTSGQTQSTTTNSTYSTQNNTGSVNSTGSSSDLNTTGTGTYSTTPPATGSTDNSSTYSSSTTTTTTSYGRENRNADKPYKAFTGGFYGGLNSTRYRGEDVDGDNLTGRLGYQLGVFVRGGGRIYGQIGAEYFASSSNFFRPGDGASLNSISGQIDTKWLQIPALVGVKLVESDRGISAVRLGVGAEYANRLSSSNTVNINEGEIRSGAFLGLVNLGFDIGPVLIDLMYHHGFSDAIRGFNNSQRRSLGLNVGFKF